MILRSLTLVPVGPVTNRAPRAANQAALSFAASASAAPSRIAPEEGAGRAAGAVEAVGVRGEPEDVRMPGGGERIFEIGAAAALAGHGHGQLAARDEGGAGRRIARDPGVGATDLARLAFAFAEDDRP